MQCPIIPSSGNASSEAVVRHFLSLHTNLVSVAEDDIIQLKLVKPTHMKKPLEDEVMLNGATNIMLASYRNQLLHVFVRVGMVALAVNSCCEDVMDMGEHYHKSEGKKTDAKVF